MTRPGRPETGRPETGGPETGGPETGGPAAQDQDQDQAPALALADTRPGGGRVRDLLDRAREALRGGQRVDPDQLLARVDALRRFLTAAGGNVPADRLAPAHALVERAGTRLALSRDHTVVALAGATGGGKSSLFNALAGLEMSPVGVRRPTTGVAHACVWGRLTGATALLDWVGVPPGHRYVRESPLDGSDERALHGLILLDLPDFDSVAESHRLEVDRLLELVDMIVWVVDPQKYADRVVHESYLRGFHRHRDVTVVVLNQVDRLPAAEVPRVVADLRRLLADDQLDGVPVLSTSARTRDGAGVLRAALEQAVTLRQAALLRLTGDLDGVTDELTELIGPAEVAGRTDQRARRHLDAALVASAGVPVVAEATEGAYRHRAAAVTGWPLVRGWRRLRPDPLRRLHLPGPAGPAEADAEEQESLVAATSVPDPGAAQRANVGLAVRELATAAASGLPQPWPAAVLNAARSRLADLPDALDRAVATTDLGLRRRPFWWLLVGTVQWLVTLTALAGLGWLLVGYALRVLGLPPLDYPMVGVAPLPTVLLLGGLFVGLLVGLLVRPLVAVGARRARRRAEQRLRDAVAGVGRDLVVEPVCSVLRAHDAAREALVAAAPRR